MHSTGSTYGLVADPEHNTETPHSIESGKFVDHLSDCQLLNEGYKMGNEL